MPNWCDNNVLIKGPISKIAPMWKVIQEQDDNNGLLNQLVPMPDDEKDNWYNWRYDHWGTKWEIDAEGLDYDEDEESGMATISGRFQSAWSPPIQAYDTFLAQNEDCEITAHYRQEGYDFAGIHDNGDDKYIFGVYEDMMDVLSGIKNFDETEPLFQEIALKLALFDGCCENYDIDDINEYRSESDLPPLEKEEWEQMCEKIGIDHEEEEEESEDDDDHDHDDEGEGDGGKYAVRGYCGDWGKFQKTFNNITEARVCYDNIKKGGRYSAIELDDITNEDEPEMIEHEEEEEEK